VGVDIPRDAPVVFTGVGQVVAGVRHPVRGGAAALLESVAPYARRLFHQMSVPDVGGIDGIPPAVAL
jgi:excinuclease ABC subunit A